MKYTEFIAEVKTIAEAAGKTEVVEFAEKELAKYEKAQETRKTYTEKKAAAKKAEKAETFEKVFAVLTAEPKTATTIVAEAGVAITRQAIPPLFKAFGEGKVEKVEVKVDGKKAVAYKLAE